MGPIQPKAAAYGFNPTKSCNLRRVDSDQPKGAISGEGAKMPEAHLLPCAPSSKRQPAAVRNQRQTEHTDDRQCRETLLAPQYPQNRNRSFGHCCQDRQEQEKAQDPDQERAGKARRWPASPVYRRKALNPHAVQNPLVNQGRRPAKRVVAQTFAQACRIISG